jgi:hypothetical protein
MAKTAVITNVHLTSILSNLLKLAPAAVESVIQSVVAPTPPATALKSGNPVHNSSPAVVAAQKAAAAGTPVASTSSVDASTAAPVAAPAAAPAAAPVDASDVVDEVVKGMTPLFNELLAVLKAKTA